MKISILKFLRPSIFYSSGKIRNLMEQILYTYFVRVWCAVSSDEVLLGYMLFVYCYIKNVKDYSKSQYLLQ